MSNEILDEVHAARERLWQRAGGTMRGLGEYLMECERRAKERGVLWIESAEEREAIGAEVRARLAREAEGAMCVGEEAGAYRAEEAHTEARRDGGAEGEPATKGTKGAKEGERGKAHAEAQRRGERGSTKGRKGERRGGEGVAGGAATGGTRMGGANDLRCNESTKPQ